MNHDLRLLHIKVQRVFGIAESCRGKQKYATEHAADKVAARMNTDNNTHNYVASYPCIFCGQWHIGRHISLEVLQKIVRENYDANGNYIGK